MNLDTEVDMHRGKVMGRDTGRMLCEHEGRDWKVEIGIMRLQTKEFQRLPAGRSKLGERPGSGPPSAPRRNQPCLGGLDNLGLGLLVSRTVSSHPVCGNGFHISQGN